MKKFLFGILFAIFSISPIISLVNVAYAQQEETKTQGEGTKPQDATAKDVWIDLTCLTWMCKWAFDYGVMVWIKTAQPDGITAKSIMQDAIFAASYMVWTVLTIVIIYCGLMYIFASRDGKDVSKYKKWLIYAAVWALLVRWGYAIVRLIQYIARW